MSKVAIEDTKNMIMKECFENLETTSVLYI